MNIYDELFAKYIIELDEAVSFEEDKIESVKEKMGEKGLPKNEIEKFIIENFDPLCCAGRVIAVFRKYWLECDKLNSQKRNNEEEDYVNPKCLTVDWLLESGNPHELYNVIADMPYFPIGINENGDYC